MLGDGHISRIKSRSTKNTKRKTNSRLIYGQSVVNCDYFYFVYNIFKNYCQGEPRENVGISKLTGSYKNLVFSTMSLPCFNYYHELFYKDNIKVIPLNINELLTPISLAFWIMDDGFINKRDKTITLCTDSFTLSEVELLISILDKNFELKCRKEKKKEIYRIVIRGSSLDKVKDLVKLHFHSSMLYKLGL